MSEEAQSEQVRRSVEIIAREMARDLKTPSPGEQLLRWAPIVISVLSVVYMAGVQGKQIEQNRLDILAERASNTESRRDLQQIRITVERVDTTLQLLTGTERGKAGGTNPK